ncbi:hypothetical protein GGTG_07440 [Gaeumannomyces tritici R3-111a-1]|uniref:CFEM domain-containing protein n=1 Tax=Gaeumannomyces tritici (strain R3-111a-1) TaxID=644352 RepID=J3P1P2_GAET3|nr:hypothetical protein GGTG_07440 [Gaeumannomyces tritici R3-111a-1]EJT73584.1 hypothetical protein GGTG_07440 [Gaeumannomyces tritici R3-111a-1]
MNPPSLAGTIALATGSAATRSISAQPRPSPSLALPNQMAIGGGGGVDCAAVGAAAVPGCARYCFTDGAAALGCRMDDLGCQRQQQARMMAAAESCVADFCPAVAYQSVIDGVMNMCACAVGAATAQPSSTMGSFSAATAVSSLTVSVSGVPSSIAPSVVSASAAPSEAPPPPRRPGVDGHRPLVATPATPQELQLALGIATTRPALAWRQVARACAASRSQRVS